METIMSYYMATALNSGMEDAIAATEAALQAEGFGVVTRIDMAATLKAKIGAEFRPYIILGACNPRLAYEALQLEDKVGTMLPCNVIVQSLAPDRTEVAAIDPVASMEAIPNDRLKSAAKEVRDRLERVISSLSVASPAGGGEGADHDRVTEDAGETLPSRL